ncbi:hypothetical protein M427DRAFT_43758 [Gonapodya prolifera JEL478]|uniref:Uncharacterized protein n=1 Tax=Gonapodya prolifera (strain JEL478) TaxID=1344416 RepID=A0A139AHM2_GONPJ|nr:hypothetical protein M427DRAFT_43758 [Gonapodya prolifera JEL478]|eukprot:KXS16322.1 hypothetical protein M427DRAFT_43758 [Gonapodya prolifera JEL478]
MLLSHPSSAPDSSRFSPASFLPGFPSYPAYPHSFTAGPPSPPASDDEDDCCMVDAQKHFVGGAAHSAPTPAKRKLSFCETVLVLETHSKLDYDRSSCEMSELTQDDIHEVLEMRREFRRQTAAATRMHQEQQAHIARLHLAARAAVAFSQSNSNSAQHQQHQPAFTRAPTSAFPAFSHPDPNGAVGLSSAARRAASFTNAHMYAPSSTDTLSPQARDHLRRYYMLAHQQQHPGSLPAPLGALDAGSVPHIDTSAQRQQHQGIDIRLAAAATKWASAPGPGWFPPSPPSSPDREGETEGECVLQQQQQVQGWQPMQPQHRQMQMQWTGGAWTAC